MENFGDRKNQHICLWEAPEDENISDLAPGENS